jgi:hypothetical protein
MPAVFFFKTALIIANAHLQRNDYLQQFTASRFPIRNKKAQKGVVSKGARSSQAWTTIARLNH